MDCLSNDKQSIFLYISIFCVPLFQHFFAKLAVNCEVTVLFGFLYWRQDSFPIPPEIAAEPIQIPSCFHCSVVEICLLLLVVAALSAQFSAAVADTSGSGGLLDELTKGKVNPKRGYAALVAVGIGFTWFTNVFEIINYASRAFAFYYALQSALAAMRAHRTRAGIGLTALYGALALLGALIVVFGKSVEGGSPPGG